MIKGLTLFEPWSSLVAYGVKRIETRSWSTTYRGLLAIHSSKNAAHTAECANLLRRAGWDDERIGGFCDAVGEWPFGKIVAVASLIMVSLTQSVEPNLRPEERCLGDYAAGRFAWQLIDVHRLDRPIPFRGSMGLWNVPPEVEREVMARRCPALEAQGAMEDKKP